MATTDILTTLAYAAFESNVLVYAFASLIIYDHILCFSQEVEYFWMDTWSLSSFLYLAIRYMTMVFAISASQLPPIMYPYIAPRITTIIMIKLFVFVLPISILCQSVITLRVWFLFSRKVAIKFSALALLITAVIASTLLVALQWNSIRSRVVNLDVSSLRSFAWAYLPPLLSHSILFLLEVYRFLTSPVRMRTDSFLWGFVKEGMFMYVFAIASLLFGVVGLAMVEPSQIFVRMPAALGSPIVALVVVSVCRVMLSLRSVAATAHVDPEWLLNHAELSRVHWRRGSVDGGIHVEVGEPAISP